MISVREHSPNENITVNVLYVKRFAQKNITLNMRHSLYRNYSGMNLFFQKYEKPLHAQYNLSSNPTAKKSKIDNNMMKQCF
jgi:hypothetical protein